MWRWWRRKNNRHVVVVIYSFIIYYINTNEIPGELDIFKCENNMLPSHVKYHRCYGYIINRAFHTKKLSK